ncbi:MAG: hypothetical protein LRY68_08445, partial [Sulfurospirillum sp.]|nr:hypothetical protein [Sulfurospirillum sp.]
TSLQLEHLFFVKKNSNNQCDNNYNGYLYESNLMYKTAVPTTIIPLNSATATLTLPTGISASEIVWAGLYWQGHIAGKMPMTILQIQRFKIETKWR